MSTTNALTIAAMIECNRRGLAAHKSYVGTGDFAARDAAGMDAVRWLEGRIPRLSEAEIAHGSWCYEQGSRGVVLSQRACADVAFGVGDQPVPATSIRELDLRAIAGRMQELDTASGRYMPVDLHAAAARGHLWICEDLSSTEDTKRVSVSALPPSDATLRVTAIV